MVKYIKGDILDVTKGIIVQQVNCIGVMGAGLAKQIKDKWPDIYNSYKTRIHNTENTKELLGKTFFDYVENNLFVASIFGQYYYGHQAKFTNYTALFKGLNSVAEISATYKTAIYIPKGLGCGLAGGNWDFVEAYIQDLDLFFDKKINIIIVEKE